MAQDTLHAGRDGHEDDERHEPLLSVRAVETGVIDVSLQLRGLRKS